MQFFDRFWSAHPALLYGLALLIGIAFALAGTWVLLIPLLVICLPLALPSCPTRLRLRILTAVAIAGCGVIGITLYTQIPDHLPIHGRARFSMTAVQKAHNHFARSWVYYGTVVSFVDDQGQLIARHIPGSIMLPEGHDRPLANQEYAIQGTLLLSRRGNFILKGDKGVPWIPIGGTWSLAEWRFQAKEWVSRYIRSHMNNRKAATFLSGIATGDFDDRLMKAAFSRFGLQHIMAISGFHFAIIAAIIGFFLRCIAPLRLTAILLLTAVTGYFLFLGFSASIIRAFVMLQLFLIAFLWEKQANPLNSLGVALLICLLVDPFNCMNLGFQLSFLTTAAILIFYSAANRLLEPVFSQRRLGVAIEMNHRNQWGYLLMNFFKQGLALTIAVNLSSLPVCLYYFHQYPVMSLPYNLFFPLLVSLSMLLLMIGGVLDLGLSFAAEPVHALNNLFTEWVLGLTFNIPRSVDIYLQADWITPLMLMGYLTLLFGAGVWVFGRMKEQESAKLL